MSQDVEDWAAPLCQGLIEPHLLFRVPRAVFIVLFIVTAISILWFWPLVCVTGGLYALAYLGTKYDPQWFEILRAHLKLRGHYEG